MAIKTKAVHVFVYLRVGCLQICIKIFSFPISKSVKQHCNFSQKQKCIIIDYYRFCQWAVCIVATLLLIDILPAHVLFLWEITRDWLE